MASEKPERKAGPFWWDFGKKMQVGIEYDSEVVGRIHDRHYIAVLPTPRGDATLITDWADFMVEAMNREWRRRGGKR